MLTISSVIYLVALCNLLCRLMASLPLYSPALSCTSVFMHSQLKVAAVRKEISLDGLC